MELRRYLTILRARWLLIVICVVAATGAAYASAPRTSDYNATATIYVGARQLGLGANQGQATSDALLAVERSITTFAIMIDSRPTAADALQRTGLNRSIDSVVGATTAVPISATQLISVNARDSDPSVARDLANGMADAFVAKVQQFEPTTPAREGVLPTLPAYVFERAQLPTAPIPLGLTNRLLIAGVLALLVVVGLVFLVEYLDITVRGPADAESRLELPVLGLIPIDHIQPDRADTRVVKLARETA
jgi:receptor protein-tyrosine kinase